METNQLEVLARLVLPSEILDYFSIVSVEDSSSEIHIHLDELMNYYSLESQSSTDIPLNFYCTKIACKRWLLGL